jgi:hypothetical protein
MIALDAFMSAQGENLKSHNDMKPLGIYMSTELCDLLLQHQASLGDIQHRISPVQLLNGDWFLCADVLTEIGEKGIFKRGFSILPKEFFKIVNVKAMPTKMEMK